MKRILVTGGAGFLGRALCTRLSSDEVICLDRVPVHGFHILHDVMDPLPKIRVDEIYHMAGTPSPVKYMADPVYTLKASVLGMINVLELARQCGSRVLLASTGDVYNANGRMSTGSCYRQGKIAAEELCLNYSRQFGVAVKIARMFNSYGPGMADDDGRVIPVFVQKALCGEDIELFGDGEQTRSYCYVDDMVDALISLMASNKEVVDIFGSEEIRIKNVASIIIDKARSISSVVLSDRTMIFPSQENPQDNFWIPRVSFNDGIEKTVKYFRGRYVGKRT
jgi:UDP-glucuronate decarboxylase